MILFTNKANQTALKLAEQLAVTSPVDNELFKSCAELLRLAENVSALKSGTDPAGSVCSLFPNSEANERVLAARSSLMEAVDQLQSVDWGLTDPVSKPRLGSTCRRTASVANSDLGVTFALRGFSRVCDNLSFTKLFHIGTAPGLYMHIMYTYIHMCVCVCKTTS